jgi:CRP-like cAMP-binding protein
MPTDYATRPTTDWSNEAKLDRLREVDIFAGLDDQELESIATVAEPVEAPAGCVLVREYSSGDGVVVVLSGTIEVIQICERVATVDAGGVVGELAALGRGRRSATLLAGTDVEAVHISGPAFTSLLEAFPDAERRLQPLVDSRTRTR